MHRILVLLIMAGLILLQPTVAQAVTQGDALNTVIATCLVGHPEEGYAEIFGPPSVLTGGSTIQELYPTEPVLYTTGASGWFFWIDYFPRARFAHDTKLVVVDETSGAIVFMEDGDWWPVLNGVVRYRNDQIGSGELLFTNNPKPSVPDLGKAGFQRLEIDLSVRDPFLAPPAAGKVCAILISAEDTAGANGVNWKAAFEDALCVYDTTNANGPRVHPDSTSTLISPTKAQVCNLLNAIPAGYDKIHFYYGGHGKRPTGEMVLSDSLMSPNELMDKLKGRAAKKYCLVMDCCFAGNYVGPFAAKGLSGSIFTASNATESGWDFLPSDGRPGSIHTEAWKWANTQPFPDDASRAAAIRDSVKKFCDTLPVDDPKTRAGGQHPQFSSAYEFTKSGEAFEFQQVPSCTTMCFQFYPVPGGSATACANVTLYCQELDFSVWGLGTVWNCLKAWNWNVGKTRYFNPDPLVSTGEYKLVSSANDYPVRVGVTWPATAKPDTPSNGTLFPGYTLGWSDASTAEFNPLLNVGAGGVPHVVPLDPFGYSLCDIPSYIGWNDTHPLILQTFVQPDPLRHWMYAGDPLNGFSGEFIVTIGAEQIDPDPFLVDLVIDQPGGNQTFGTSQFLPVSSGGFEAQFFLLGGLDVEDAQYSIFLQPNIPSAPATERITGMRSGIYTPPRRPDVGVFDVAAPAGVPAFLLDFVTVDFINDVLALDAPGNVPVGARPTLAAFPNPFGAQTTIRFEVPKRGAVDLRVFDVRGRLVRTLEYGTVVEGEHVSEWDGRDDSGKLTPAGVYFYQLSGKGFRETKKLVRAH